MKQWKKWAVGAALCGVFGSAFAEEMTLRFSWWGGNSRHEATQKAIKLFESRNPGVVIKPEINAWNGYSEKLIIQMSGGNEPDIMQLDWSWLSMFSRDGNGFYDLYKAKDVLNLGEWENKSYLSGEVNGKLNAVPYSRTVRLPFWNKTTLDKAGVAVPKTWDAFLNAGNTLQTKLGKDYYAFDGVMRDVYLMAHAYVYQKTGKPYIDPKTNTVAWTEKDALEWVQMTRKIYDSKAATPFALRLGLGGDEKPAEQQSDWANGKWGATYTWDSTFRLRASALPKDNKWAVGEMPTMPGAKNSGYFSRPAMMIAVSKNSKHPQMAAKFVNFMLTDPEAIKILGLERGVVMTKTGLAVLEKEGRLNDWDRRAMSIMQSSKIDLPSPYFEYPRTVAFLRDVFEANLMGRLSDQDAAKRLIGEGNLLLRRMKK